MQFLCGFECFQKEFPFDISLLVTFRKRLTATVIDEINQPEADSGRREIRSSKTEIPHGADNDKNGGDRTNSSISDYPDAES